MKKRDLTYDQLKYRASKLGIHPEALGYWKLSDGKTSVYAKNAGTYRRDQLRYLTKENKFFMKRMGQGL
jgi:hypothetical protein